MYCTKQRETKVHLYTRKRIIYKQYSICYIRKNKQTTPIL